MIINIYFFLDLFLYGYEVFKFIGWFKKNCLIVFVVFDLNYYCNFFLNFCFNIFIFNMNIFVFCIYFNFIFVKM